MELIAGFIFFAFAHMDADEMSWKIDELDEDWTQIEAKTEEPEWIEELYPFSEDDRDEEDSESLECA